MVGEKNVLVRFYLMEATGRGRRGNRSTKHVWVPLKSEIYKESDSRTQALLGLAEERRQ